MLPLYAVRSRCQAESSGFFPLGQLQLQPQLPASSSISSGDIGLQASSALNTAFHIGQSSLGSDTPHIAGHGAPLRGVIVVGQPSLSMQSNIITSWNPWYALRSKCQALLCPCRGQPYGKAQTAVAKWGYLYLSAGCKLGGPTCGRFRHRPSGVRGQRPRKRSAGTKVPYAGVACYEEIKKETKHTTGARSWAGFPPARRWPSHLPQKPKKATTKDRKRTSRPPPRDDWKKERGYSTFFATFVHVKICTAQRGKNSNNPS